MIRQVKTRMVTAKSIINKKAFVDGYNQASKGLPIDYDYSANKGRSFDTSTQWAYERGRCFAFIWQGPLKHGNKVTQSAQYALGEAFRSGIIL
jgi:hypothetical protein